MEQKITGFLAETSSIYLLEGIQCRLEGKLLYLSDGRVLGFESEKESGLNKDRLIIGRQNNDFLFIINLNLSFTNLTPVYLHYLKKAPITPKSVKGTIRYSGRWGELPEVDKDLLSGVEDYVEQILKFDDLQKFDLKQLLEINTNLDVFKLINSRNNEYVAYYGENEYRQFKKLN